MPLESTVICLDNSEWMRNGDYTPSRMEAQSDAANMICQTKTGQNPESTVGILCMAGKTGKGVEVLVSPTEDMGKLLGSMHGVPTQGTSNFANAMQVAQLALKHRRNKKGDQRIVVFVGSPIDAEEKALIKIGKQLAKNNVAADVVSMGEVDDNSAKLEAFIGAVNKSNNSHLVVVPAGVLPSDVLMSSPVIHGADYEGGGGGGGGAAAGGGGGASGSGGNFAEYGGVDPGMDPELALALRVSMEEERARQETASKGEGEGDAPAAAADGGEPATPAAAGAAATPVAPVKAEEAAPAAAPSEDDLLSQALAMSMAEGSGGDGGGGGGNEGGGGGDLDEDEAMQLALQMSMGIEPASAPAPAPAAPAPAAGGAASAATAAAFMDPAFVNQLLSGLPGVDPNDPKIKAAMASIADGSTKDKKDEEKKDEEKKE